jgi:tRNA-intron endonuclease
MRKSIPTAELLQDHLVVWDIEEACGLYAQGYYGKPVGVSKPKQDGFDSPLVLDLVEGLFLLENGLIAVKDARGRAVKEAALRRRAEKVYEGFGRDYLVYRDLRLHGKIVLSGIKFGCEFAVYEHGPGIDHAPYLVSVKEPDDDMSSTEVVRAGRLATTVRKRFIVAVPNMRMGQIQYLMFDWFRA